MVASSANVPSGKASLQFDVDSGLRPPSALMLCYYVMTQNNMERNSQKCSHVCRGIFRRVNWSVLCFENILYSVCLRNLLCEILRCAYSHKDEWSAWHTQNFSTQEKLHTSSIHKTYSSFPSYPFYTKTIRIFLIVFFCIGKYIWMVQWPVVALLVFGSQPNTKYCSLCLILTRWNCVV